MKKLVSLLLVVLIATTFTGGLSAIADNPLTIQVVLPSNVQDFPNGITEDDNYIVDYWKAKTGNNFDCVILSNEDAETQLNTMLNAGECNGIIIARNAENVGKFADEGLILSLDDYKDKCTLYSMNDCTAGFYKGQQYAFCQSDSINYSIQNGMWYVNKGIAEELGYDHSPATYDEFVEYLYKAKAAGYLPLAIFGDPGSGISSFTLLQGLYGFGGGEYGVDENGQVYYKYVTDQAKEYLLFVKKLFDDGLIPSDFASQTADGVGELLLSEKAASGTGINIWNTGVMKQGRELGLDLRFTDYPSDINGNPSWGNINVGYGGTSLVFMISNSCKNVDACIDLINLWCTDECISLTNYGIEGVNWEYDADGAMQTIEGSDSIAWGVYYRNVYKLDYWYDVYGVNADWAEFYYPSERSIVGCPNYDPIIHMAVNAEYVQKLDDMRDEIVIPFFTKVVMGDESIDNWDKMVEQWNKQGGKELMEYYTKTYADNGSPVTPYWTQLPDEHSAYTGEYLYDGAEAAQSQATVSDFK